jgi:5-enolpyruvylshikimate-3-phosphate synthase
VIDNPRRMGVEAGQLPDGMTIPGRRKFRAAQFDSFGGGGLGVLPGIPGNAG